MTRVIASLRELFGAPTAKRSAHGGGPSAARMSEMVLSHVMERSILHDPNVASLEPFAVGGSEAARDVLGRRVVSGASPRRGQPLRGAPARVPLPSRRRRFGDRATARASARDDRRACVSRRRRRLAGREPARGDAFDVRRPRGFAASHRRDCRSRRARPGRRFAGGREGRRFTA